MFRLSVRHKRVLYGLVLVALMVAVPAAVLADGTPPVWEPKPPGGGGAPSSAAPDGIAESLGITLALAWQLADAV